VKAKPTYRSPLRADQSAATRERILLALESILRSGDLEAASYKAIAQHAGVREITVYRHFPNKVELLRSFWTWINERRGDPELATTEVELLAQVRAEFAAADDLAPLLAASLTSREGREMQKSWNAERRETLERALERWIGTLPDPRRTQVLAILHLLMSGHAWLAMRDLWGLDGKQAGDAAAWALAALFRQLEAERRVTVPRAPRRRRSRS
jgi:AcrR family transcriptional regulator